MNPNQEKSGSEPSKKRGTGRVLLLFLFLGGLLFWVESLVSDPEPIYSIAIGPKTIASLEQGWTNRIGRAPDADVLDALIHTQVDDELLIAQARALGWHRNDAIVQRRLVQNQRFVTEDEEITDSELLERAYQQGMDQSDIVVRRRLLERMRLLIATVSRRNIPSEEELQSYLDEHAERFSQPERTRLTQIYLSRDTRGEELTQQAKDLTDRLRRDKIAPEEASQFGDPFLISQDLPLSSESTLARQLGNSFAAEALLAPEKKWSDPISSRYGVHIVWPHEKTAARQPPLDEVRSRVKGEWQREHEKQALREHIDRLREQAHIEIIRP